MLAERKQKIYDLCVKYDVIIVEDEPYYFLYSDPWVPRAGKQSGQALRAYDNFKDDKKGVEEFFKKLPPSYLRFDYQGRVIRLDTFSKTIAPGSRLGWFTANPLFTERLLRGCESAISSPNGIGQAMITKLMLEWGYDGYIRWLRGIKATYAMRRDWMCDLLESTFHLEFNQSLPVSQHIKWITAYEKTAPGMGGAVLDEKRGYKAQKPLVSFVPPSAGMFVWLAVHLDSHKDFEKVKARGEDPNRVLLEKLFIELAEHKVLVVPGFFFDAQPGQPHKGSENIGFLRLAFSFAPHDEMKQALEIMSRVIIKFFA